MVHLLVSASFLLVACLLSMANQVVEYVYYRPWMCAYGGKRAAYIEAIKLHFKGRVGRYDKFWWRLACGFGAVSIVHIAVLLCHMFN